MNDSVNGVYLPHSSNVKNNTEAYHRKIHTEQYYKEVFSRLNGVAGNRTEIIKTLEKISDDLKNNKMSY